LNSIKTIEGEFNMKKHIAYIIIFICLSSCVYAQDAIEVQAGINFANLSDPGNLDPHARWTTLYGLSGSCAVILHLGGNLFLSPGVRFIQKGTQVDWSPSSNIKDVSTTMSYLEVPIYVQYRFIDAPIQVSVLGGPTVSYLLRSKTEGTNQNVYGSYDSKDEYKSMNAAFDLGLRAAVPLNEQFSLVASAIYSYGLIKISNPDYIIDSKEMTRDFIVLVGISYSLQ
jgi:hypothetical protein